MSHIGKNVRPLNTSLILKNTVGAFNISSQLDINVSKRERDIDKNAAAFILQGAIDYLNN